MALVPFSPIWPVFSPMQLGSNRDFSVPLNTSLGGTNITDEQISVGANFTHSLALCAS